MIQIIEVKNEEDFYELIGTELITIVLFSAEWAEQCSQVRLALAEISKLGYPNLQFVNLPAETYPQICQKYKVGHVPTVIFYSSGIAIDRVNGVDVMITANLCKKLAKDQPAAAPPLEDRLKELISKADIMVFMKGTRDTPRCGFSKQLIGILNETGMPYETFDILGDEEVRQGLKTYSDWPTYPQVYVKGQLIGGLDIIKELLSTGQLLTTLKPT